MTRPFKALLTALALLFVALLSCLPALAQGIVRSEHGDWQLTCDQPPGASTEQCALIQNVTAEDQPGVGLSVIVLKLADGQETLLRVLAPLGVLLRAPSADGTTIVGGLGLNVDGEFLGRADFVRCLPNGCVAEVILSSQPEILDKLKRGNVAYFIVYKTPEEGIGVEVSLDGFTGGYEALP